MADIMRGAFQLLAAVGLPASMVVLVAGLPLAIIQYFVPNLPFIVSSLWDFFVGTLADMIVLHLAWQAIVKRGQRVAVGAAFSAVGQRVGALLGTRFICNWVTFLFTLLLIVPGVMKALSLAVAMPIVLHEGADASSAMASSTARMKGQRGQAFLAYCLALAPFFVLFLALVCIAAAQGFAQGLDTTTVPAESSAVYGIATLVLGVLTPVALMPAALVTAVLYAKRPQPEYSDFL